MFDKGKARAVKNMVKKLRITVRLLPEAQSVANDSIKAEVEKEIKKAIYVIPWADQLESIEVEEAAN